MTISSKKPNLTPLALAVSKYRPLTTSLRTADQAIDFASDESVGEFNLLHEFVSIRAEARYREGDKDINLFITDIHNSGQQQQGHGTEAMQMIFHIADMADIETVSLRTDRDGRYAHAANHIHCFSEEWGSVQRLMLKNLENYRAAVAPELEKTAQQQMETATTTIMHANGQMGDVVTILRTLPNLSSTARVWPHLAKLVLLQPHSMRNYGGYWDKKARAQSRAAFISERTTSAKRFIGLVRQLIS